MSEVIKILIVDDEPLAHDILKKYCARLDYIEVKGSCFDGVSTLNFLKDQTIDAILLDIQLPDITGIELVNILQQRAPKIIFTTAYTEHALQSFDFDQVIDYLNKPIGLPRFIKAIERLKHQLELEEKVNEKNLEPERNSVIKEIQHLLVKDDKVIHKIPLDDIAYIQSWGNYLKVFLKNEKVRLLRKTISEMEEEIGKVGFTRIHKSYMVNVKYVTALDGNQAIISDQKLPIGRSYRISAFDQLFGKKGT
jgi:DNA-binding LytR/AlgR family response regulator